MYYIYNLNHGLSIQHVCRKDKYFMHTKGTHNFPFNLLNNFSVYHSGTKDKYGNKKNQSNYT